VILFIPRLQNLIVWNQQTRPYLVYLFKDTAEWPTCSLWPWGK